MNPRLAAEILAQKATRALGVRWGEALGYYFVTGYPRSGGTWLAQMVGDYLRLPFPQHAVRPPLDSCVVQNHWPYDPRLRRVAYVYRDGRDVMTSLYYFRLRVARHGRGPGGRRVARQYERLLGRGYDPADVVRHMPRFIEFELTRPGRGSRLGWPDHTADWVQPGRDRAVAYAAYEELRQDCAGTLARVVERLTGEPADRRRVAATVEAMSMKRATGRDPGDADARAHIRKAIVGDWRNHFSREAAEVFDRLAGHELVRLGYESDPGWVDRYDYRSP